MIIKLYFGDDNNSYLSLGMCTAALEALGARVHKRMVIRDATVKLRCTGPVKADLMEAHSTTGEMGM